MRVPIIPPASPTLYRLKPSCTLNKDWDTGVITKPTSVPIVTPSSKPNGAGRWVPNVSSLTTGESVVANIKITIIESNETPFNFE